MFYLQPAQPAQSRPFSDWLATCQRVADHQPRPMSRADWDSPAWDALFNCGLSPREAVDAYLED